MDDEQRSSEKTSDCRATMKNLCLIERESLYALWALKSQLASESEVHRKRMVLCGYGELYGGSTSEGFTRRALGLLADRGLAERNDEQRWLWRATAEGLSLMAFAVQMVETIKGRGWPPLFRDKPAKNAPL